MLKNSLFKITNSSLLFRSFIIKLLKRREILLLLSKKVCLSVGPE